MLTGACASSSPEPASAPTPAADSAALARAASRAAITAREQYYDIDGSSAGALRNQISRLGPKDESGKSKDALTVWSLEWAYGTVQRGDRCALRDVKVTLDVSVTLPRWTPPSTATAQLIGTWRTYLRNVKLHESGHRTIAERNARELMSALTALRGASCDKLSDEATRTAERIVADGRARNRAYDVQTKHGQTQGVELGP
jgi:predicted secreted Zn-dependent protease